MPDKNLRSDFSVVDKTKTICAPTPNPIKSISLFTIFLKFNFCEGIVYLIDENYSLNAAKVNKLILAFAII